MRSNVIENLRSLSNGDQVTASFVVEAEVLGKRLANHHLEASIGKRSERGCVLVWVARCEALVSGVEDGKVVLGADDLGELVPLLSRGISTSGVVRARMEENDRAVGRGLEIRNELRNVGGFDISGPVRVRG